MCDHLKIGERIKQAREDLGFTQEQLGKMIGVNKSTIQRYETGKINKLKLPVIQSIAKALLVNPDWIILHSNKKQIIPSPSEVDPDALAIKMYKTLDPDDKAEIRGEMKQMLKADKYSGDAPVPVTYLFSMPFYNIPVSAGTGEFLDSDDYEMLDLTDEPPRGANFIVRVSGDSMEPTYHDGDKLFIKQQPNIEVGEIGIFMIDGNVYVKEFDSDGLISHNDKYDKIKFTEFENIRCYGKVVGKVDE